MPSLKGYVYEELKESPWAGRQRNEVVAWYQMLGNEIRSRKNVIRDLYSVVKTVNIIALIINRVFKWGI